MPLSDIIDRSITLNTTLGITKQPQAKAMAVDLVAKDAGATREAIDIAVAKLIHDQATRTMRRMGNKPGSEYRQTSFFGDRLRARYALDADSKVIKDLDCLSRLEFKRIARLRQKQVADDTYHLEAMLEAERELEPIWATYPDKSYGEVERMYLARRRAA